MNLHYYQVSQGGKKNKKTSGSHGGGSFSARSFDFDTLFCGCNKLAGAVFFGEETQHSRNILGQGNADTAHFADYFLQFLVNEVDSKKSARLQPESTSTRPH